MLFSHKYYRNLTLKLGGGLLFSKPLSIPLLFWLSQQPSAAGRRGRWFRKQKQEPSTKRVKWGRRYENLGFFLLICKSFDCTTIYNNSLGYHRLHRVWPDSVCWPVLHYFLNTSGWSQVDIKINKRWFPTLNLKIPSAGLQKLYKCWQSLVIFT